MGKSVYIGIDEVGRGPLAGPVEVGAVLVDAHALKELKNAIQEFNVPLRDSKKLSPKQREAWTEHLMKMRRKKIVYYATARVSPKIIDVLNISRAINRAAEKAIQKTIILSHSSRASVRIFSDAGIRPDVARISGKNIRFNAYVRGDETIPLISLASIAAKVSRDSYMSKMAERYPGYHFDVHKGYGTKEHIRAIRRLGPSPLHRLTFLGNFSKIE